MNKISFIPYIICVFAGALIVLLLDKLIHFLCMNDINEMLHKMFDIGYREGQKAQIRTIILKQQDEIYKNQGDAME